MGELCGGNCVREAVCGELCDGKLCGWSCFGKAVWGVLFHSCLASLITEVFIICYPVICSSECAAKIVLVVQSSQTL